MMVSSFSIDFPASAILLQSLETSFVTAVFCPYIDGQWCSGPIIVLVRKGKIFTSTGLATATPTKMAI